MAIPWNGLGAPPWGCHGMLLSLSHVDPPMAIPWNGIGTSHGEGIPWHASMGRCWGSHPMAIPWNGIGASHGWIPWNASIGSSWGSPNGTLCVAYGDHSQWPFHGMALGHPLGDVMECF